MKEHSKFKEFTDYVNTDYVNGNQTTFPNFRKFISLIAKNQQDVTKEDAMKWAYGFVSTCKA